MKKNILVLGLKTFGMSIVKQLSKYNCEVLAIDKEMERVEAAAEYATHAIQIDVRNAEEMSELSFNFIASLYRGILVITFVGVIKPAAIPASIASFTALDIP